MGRYQGPDEHAERPDAEWTYPGWFLGLKELHVLSIGHLPQAQGRAGRGWPCCEDRWVGCSWQDEVLDCCQQLEHQLGGGWLLPDPPRQGRVRHRDDGAALRRVPSPSNSGGCHRSMTGMLALVE